MAEEPRLLTDHQIKQIGERLYDTSRNIFTEIEDVLGTRIPEGQQDAYLSAVAVGYSLQKCCECSMWRDISEFSPDHIAPTCNECAEEME